MTQPMISFLNLEKRLEMYQSAGKKKVRSKKYLWFHRINPDRDQSGDPEPADPHNAGPPSPRLVLRYVWYRR